MTHPPEELLIQHAFGLTDLDDHLQACATCSSDVEEIVSFTSQEPSRPIPHDLAILSQSIEQEQQNARELLGTLDGNLDLALEDERFWTTGGMTALLGHLVTMRRHDPISAMAIATRLRDRAHHLPPEIRVDLLREAASTARSIGAYDSAQELLDEAAATCEELVVSDFALARIWYERARLEIDTQTSAGANLWAQRAAQVFLRFGDARRYHRSLYLSAVAHYNDRDYSRTISALEELLPSLEGSGDRETLALAWSTIGHAAAREDALDKAELAFQRALVLCEELDWPIEVLRSEWGIARILLKRGETATSLALSERVQKGFDQYGLVEEAGLVGLDRAEALILLGETERARHVCRETIEILSGRLARPDQQRALAYLRETSLTAPRLHVVSKFLIESREQPGIPFIPPAA